MRIGSRDGTQGQGPGRGAKRRGRALPAAAAVLAAGVVLGSGLAGPALATPDEDATPGTSKPAATKAEPDKVKIKKRNVKPEPSGSSSGSGAVKGWARAITDPAGGTKSRTKSQTKTRAETRAGASPSVSAPTRAAAPTIEATPDPDNSAPAATEPVITEVIEGDGTLTVKWEAPDSGPPTSYTVWAGGDVADPDCDELEPDVYECTVKGLENEVSYAIEVAANGGGDDAQFSQAWWATPHTTTVDPPGTPTLHDIEVDGNRLMLTWDEPADGGAAIIGYRITAMGGDDPVPCVQPEGRADTKCTITGVSGVEYTATVAAWNSEGQGTASAEKTATAASSVPGTPTVTAELSGDTVTVTASSADTGGVTVDGYEITVTAVDGDAVVECAGTTTSEPVLYTTGTCTFQAVQGESYSVRARAHNSVGWSEAATVTRTTAPAAPSVTVGVQGREVTVSWTPHGTGGAPILGYQVDVHSEGQSGSVDCTGEMGSGDQAGWHLGTSCTFTGVPGSEYTASVKAANSVGTSNIAGSAEEMVPPLAGPAGLKLEPGDGTATVSWTPITPATGITGYVVTYATEGGVPQTAPVQGAGTGMSELTGLENGETYTVMVKAVLDEGEVLDSEAMKVTPAAPPAIPATAPEPDGTLSAPAGASTPDAGETITVSGSGFAPNSEVTVVIYSSPQTLGTTVTDQAGAFSTAVTIPAGLSGAHTITSLGIDPDGEARVLALGVTIAGSTTSTSTGDGSGSGGLAVTGAPVVTILLTGILLIAGGAAGRFLGRGPGRRREVHRAAVSPEELEAADRVRCS